MITVSVILAFYLNNGEYRQDIKPCLYAYCAKTREEAEMLHKNQLKASSEQKHT